MRRALLLLPVLALAVAVAGCGGGGGKETSGQPLTKAEYEAKLQAIVKDVGARIGDTATEANSPEALKEAVKALEEVADELAKVKIGRASCRERV